MTFHWVFAGQYVASEQEIAGVGPVNNFSTQEDAEEWLGQTWVELADLGVESVTLMSGDEIVLGPMDLS